MILIPELILLKYTKELLNLMREELSTSVQEKSTLLYQLFFENKRDTLLHIERYQYFTQLKTILLRDIDSTRYLDVDLMFNMKRDSVPSIHITSPAEQNKPHSMGVGSGNLPEVYWGDFDPNDKTISSTYQRRYGATYDIVVTSDNSNEVVALYHLLKALFTSIQPLLTLEGLENITISGQDLTPYAELVPKNMFVRAMRLQLEYETGTIDILKHPIFTNLTIQGFPKNR